MVGKNTKIKNGSTIEGPVIIGENCLINGVSYIGPNTSIGNNSILHDCTIDNSIIMDGCNIDCKISITNSIVSYNSKITSSQQKKAIFILGEDTTIILWQILIQKFLIMCL